MDLYLQNKAAIVVGGSRGIGKAIAHRFAEEGVNVGICARSDAELQTTADELRDLGVEVYASSCDAGKAGELEQFLDHVKDALLRVDILVNNVSALSFGDDEASWRLSFDVDLLAAVRATRKVVPWMIAAGGGSVIHISSISGLAAGSPPAYAAMKAALISHSKTLAVTLATDRIRVNVVAPGSIYFANGFWDRIKAEDRTTYDAVLETIPWGRMGRPEEVADAVVYLSSPRASWITGVCLSVDGGQQKSNL